jgi:hypothetical protein
MARERTGRRRSGDSTPYDRNIGLHGITSWSW